MLLLFIRLYVAAVDSKYRIIWCYIFWIDDDVMSFSLTVIRVLRIGRLRSNRIIL